MRSRRHHDPLPSRLTDAILSLQPTAYWPLDDGNGPLRDLTGRWPATVTGTPLYGVAAPSPIGRGVTWPGGSVYATTSTSIPTPTASISVLAIFSTTDATAALRGLAGRAATSQNSWNFHVNASHRLEFILRQSGGSAHASCSPSAFGAVNNGSLMIAAATFTDAVGGTAWIGRVSGGTLTAAATGALTSTWHRASTAGISIAALGATLPFIGSEFHVAYWNDRVLTTADVRYIQSIAGGG